MPAFAFRPVQRLLNIVSDVRRHPRDAFLVALVILLAALLLASGTGGTGAPAADHRSPTAGGAGGQGAPVAQVVPSDTGSPAAPGAPAAQTFITCTPNQVMTFKGRIHVRCSTSFSGISYFAISTADPSMAARVLSIASTALVSGRQVGIWYDPADLSGAAIGCQTGDCRLIIGLGL